VKLLLPVDAKLHIFPWEEEGWKKSFYMQLYIQYMYNLDLRSK